MNDARSYAAHLRRWAAGLRAVLFSRGADGRGSRPPRGRVFVLQGDDALVGGLLTSLRSEAVDRDRRGRPCKERQAKGAPPVGDDSGGRVARRGVARGDVRRGPRGRRRARRAVRGRGL